MKKRHIKTLLLATFLCVITAFHIQTRQQLISSRKNLSFDQRDGYLFPQTHVIRAFTLNYTTVAATGMWIQLLVYFGDWRLSKHTAPPHHLMDYADAIIKLDSSFYPVYPWIGATYVNSRLETTGATHETLLELSEFLISGRKYFPNEYELPYLAGLNFIGYSEGHSKEERLIEYERGADYLEECIQLPECPAVILLTIKQMRKRAEDLKSKLGKQNKSLPQEPDTDLLIKIYQTNSDPKLHKQLASELQKVGLDSSSFHTLNSTRLNKNIAKSKLNYLSSNEWVLIVYPRN